MLNQVARSAPIRTSFQAWLCFLSWVMTMPSIRPRTVPLLGMQLALAQEVGSPEQHPHVTCAAQCLSPARVKWHCCLLSHGAGSR